MPKIIKTGKPEEYHQKVTPDYAGDKTPTDEVPEYENYLRKSIEKKANSLSKVAEFNIIKAIKGRMQEKEEEGRNKKQKIDELERYGWTAEKEKRYLASQEIIRREKEKKEKLNARLAEIDARLLEIEALEKSIKGEDATTKITQEEIIPEPVVAEDILPETEVAEEKKDDSQSRESGRVSNIDEELSAEDVLHDDAIIKREDRITEELSAEDALLEANTVIDQIPQAEKLEIEVEMQNGKLMEFESPEVKTNYKDFIKNNIVKFVSGFGVPPKIKNIIERNAKKVLITTAVLTIWVSGCSTIKPAGTEGNISYLKKKELVDTTSKKIEVGDMNTYNKLSENGKSIYLYAMSKISNQCYLIVDKPRSTLYVIGKDKKMIIEIPVIIGKTKGETPNASDVQNFIKENATTPAGKYILGMPGEDVSTEDSILYKGEIFSVLNSNNLGFHITYPKELKAREAALNTPTLDDNRMSYGCVGINEQMWIKYIKNNFNGNETLFITPDYPETASLNPETGKVESKTHDTNLFAMNTNVK